MVDRPAFEELAGRMTPMGDISLRRRIESSSGADVFEVKLGEEFLMSSLFTAGEIALARLSLERSVGDELDVIVGGLGLGYTAAAVLDDPRVRSLRVVEALSDVVTWHRDHLLPTSERITADPRCTLVVGDFFEMVSTRPVRRFDVVAVDIDHTPSHHLHPSHAAFYRPEGLSMLSSWLAPGGVFGLWSDDPPDPDFQSVAEGVFGACEAEVATFDNPVAGGTSANTIYLATNGA